jgi:hypothetical protein
MTEADVTVRLYASLRPILGAIILRSAARGHQVLNVLAARQLVMGTRVEQFRRLCCPVGHR